ncbi:MAG: thiamine-phosphate kinase, partial [Porticoccaceae bacterium]
LTGGDDYQLCFTVSEDKLEAMEQLVAAEKLNVTEIGTIGAADRACLVTVLDGDGEPVEIQQQGYKHFGQ